jgi:hypothetical protein
MKSARKIIYGAGFCLTLLILGCVNDPHGAASQITMITDNAHLDVVSVSVVSGIPFLAIDHANHEQLLEPETTILKVRASGRSVIGSDTGFSFLGLAGTSVWNLDGGWSVRGVSSGVVDGDTLVLRLHSVEGPGKFGVWRFDGQSKPSINFASIRGFPQDLTMSRTAHLHRTWSFSAPGEWQIQLEVFAFVGGDLRTSGIRRYSFVVEE